MTWRALGLAIASAATLCLPSNPATADGNGVVVATVQAAGSISIELDVPDRKIQAGNPFDIEATIAGDLVDPVTVRLLAPNGLLLRGADSQPAELRAGKEARVRWSACAEEPGHYVVMGSVVDDTGTLAESPAVGVEIVAKARSSCPAPWQR